MFRQKANATGTVQPTTRTRMAAGSCVLCCSLARDCRTAGTSQQLFLQQDVVVILTLLAGSFPLLRGMVGLWHVAATSGIHVACTRLWRCGVVDGGFSC